MYDLLSGRTPTHLAVIDKNSVRDYIYRREDTETLNTAIGELATVVYSSQHPGSPRITRFWIAPARGYLPMRVEQKRQDSVEWTMALQTLDMPGIPPSATPDSR